MVYNILSCDWGTSTFRLRLVAREDARILTELRSNEGAKTIAEQFPDAGDARAAAFQQVLEHHIREICLQADIRNEGIPVIISGMAGGSIGWKELPYTPLPISLTGQGIGIELLGEVTVPAFGAFPVMLISGISTPGDVIRGEETQIIGLFQHTDYAQYREKCLLILPGTHSKHVTIQQHTITDFTTYMTGELFDLLKSHSILAHSLVGGALRLSEPFDDGVLASTRAPLSQSLFQVRARQLLYATEPADSAEFLCGLLIGSELACLSNETAPTTPLLLAATAQVADYYLRGCELLGFKQRCIAIPPALVEHSAILGHLALYQSLEKEREK